MKKRSINTPIEEMRFLDDPARKQPLIAYEDGSIKKIGQKRTFADCPESYVVRTKTNDVYLVEKPRVHQKTKKKKRTNQSLEMPEPYLSEKDKLKRLLELQKENKYRRNQHEDEMIPADWKRIESTDEVPKSFYMSTPFDTAKNKDFIPSDVPLSPYHLFKLFFDTRIYKLIVRETNVLKNQVYATMQHEARREGVDPSKVGNTTSDFDEIDLDGYLSILIAMGVHQMRCPKDYWRKNAYIHNEIACMMKITKFMEFDRFLHLADNQNPNIQKDIIGKVREYMNIINGNFKKYYYPGEYLSIDEGMIPFMGKVAFKIYNPDKPDKFGMKEFVVCDAKNAYTLETQLYHGNHEDATSAEHALSKTNEVVMHLLRDYENQQHKVVMDNYYNSPGLYYVMKQKGFGGLGTMRIPRLKLPSSLLAQIMEVHQGKTLAYVQGDINLAIFFRGTNDKEICLMSNYQDQRQVQADYWRILADIKEDRPITKDQSFISAYYNKYKGGVDRRNGFLAAYRNKRKNVKWWRPVFYRMLDNAIVNAFILYNFNKSPKFQMSQKEFRICLFKQLANRYSPPKSEMAIRELQKMRMNADAVSKDFDYFDSKMQQHIMRGCNYAAHKLIKSKTKQKACVECKVLTSFFCSSCMAQLNVPVPVCASGFNQCYDVHSCKSFEEVALAMVDKRRRRDGRYIKEVQKKERRLMKLGEVILFDSTSIKKAIQKYEQSRYANSEGCDEQKQQEQRRILRLSIKTKSSSDSKSDAKVVVVDTDSGTEDLCIDEAMTPGVSTGAGSSDQMISTKADIDGTDILNYKRYFEELDDYEINQKESYGIRNRQREQRRRQRRNQGIEKLMVINCEETDEEGVKREADCIVVGSEDSMDDNSEDDREYNKYSDKDDEVLCLGSKGDMVSSTSYHTYFGTDAASTTAGLIERTASEERNVQRRKGDRIRDVDESWIGRRLRKLDGVDYDDPAVTGYRGGYRPSEAPIELEGSDDNDDGEGGSCEAEIIEGASRVELGDAFNNRSNNTSNLRDYEEVSIDHFAKRAIQAQREEDMEYQNRIRKKQKISEQVIIVDRDNDQIEMASPDRIIISEDEDYNLTDSELAVIDQTMFEDACNTNFCIEKRRSDRLIEENKDRVVIKKDEEREEIIRDVDDEVGLKFKEEEMDSQEFDQVKDEGEEVSGLNAEGKSITKTWKIRRVIILPSSRSCRRLDTESSARSGDGNHRVLSSIDLNQQPSFSLKAHKKRIILPSNRSRDIGGCSTD